MDSLMFGHTLRMLRTTAGLSLRTLAKKIDVSPAYLSQIELGKLPPPTHSRITKIAEIIDISVSMLIEMSNRPNPEIILMMQERKELKELIKLTLDIGLDSRDIYEINALMRKLGGSGFRKYLHFGVEHSSDFMQKASSGSRKYVSTQSINRKALSEWVNPQLVFPKLDFTKKSDLLLYLMKKIGAIYRSLNINLIHEELLIRESETSSGLGNGVAIPHLFVENLDRTVIAVAKIPKGMDFDAIDQRPVYLICLILSSQKDHRLHLNLLAYLAQKLQYPAYLKKVLKTESEKQLLSLLFDMDEIGLIRKFI